MHVYTIFVRPYGVGWKSYEARSTLSKEKHIRQFVDKLFMEPHLHRNYIPSISYNLKGKALIVMTAFPEFDCDESAVPVIQETAF